MSLEYLTLPLSKRKGRHNSILPIRKGTPVVILFSLSLSDLRVAMTSLRTSPS